MRFRNLTIAGMLLTVFKFFMSPVSAQAGAGVITCYMPVCVMTFRTNAAWLQRVHIRRLGTGWRRVFVGRGEGRLHRKFLVRRGSYLVRLRHWRHGGWRGSWVRRGRRCIRANDNGPRGDYNDAIVCVRGRF